MLGWDFAPALSGGVGTACRGIATALARAGAEVLFVLPRVQEDAEASGVRWIAADRVPLAADRSRRATPRRASETRAPTLDPPEKALRLLTLDSPLQPYLSPKEYEERVRSLLARPERERRLDPGLVEEEKRGARLEPGVPRAKTSGPGLAIAGGGLAVLREDPWQAELEDELERFARAVLQVAAGERFDVIHAHEWMSFPAGILVHEATGKRLVCHFHSTEFDRRPLAPDPRARAIEQSALIAAERVVCVSQESARILRRHYAVEPAKLRVVHNAFGGIDGTRAVARKPSDPPLILFLGRLTHQKDPLTFLEAAARVHELEPRVRFAIGGSGELYPELVAKTRELGLAGVVGFIGFVSGAELARSYARADAYVMPSVSEPFGLTTLEAAALGVPVIVSRTAGVTEVLRSCLKFDPGDAEGLAEKILSLLKRPELRRHLSEQGLREVRRLRWDRPARELLGIYDEVS